MTWHVVLATGASLLPQPQAVADRIRHLPTVAVSDAYELAPWAAAIVACDGNWWLANSAARAFAGEKWCANGAAGIPVIPRGGPIGSGTNSGLLGLHYWVSRGATSILLLGIDMRGTHYFGPHNKPRLHNTAPARFALFKEQFRAYSERMPKNVCVVNCSPDSALDVFPKRSLDELLQDAA